MTDCLLHGLTLAVSEPLHTVLHVGAGTAPAQNYAGLAFAHLHLVEGDPDTFADLAAELQLSARAGVQALHRVVLPQASAVLWHRYNVRRLNAPQPMSELKAVYPRLLELSQLPQEGVAFEALASDLLPQDAHHPPTANALVLDVPGQEAALLAALPSKVLHQFQYVAVRAAAQPTGTAWVPLSQTVERLEGLCFRQVGEPEAQADPLWPVAVMRFDADAFARAQLVERSASLEAALAQANASAAIQAAELHAQIDSLSQGKATAERQAAERAAQLQQMTQQRDEHAKQAAERQAQIDSLSQAKVTAEKQAAERAAQLQQMTQQRDEQAKQAAERQAQLDSLSQAKDIAEKHAVELQAQIDSLSQAKLTAENQAAERASQLQQMTQQRDEQSKQVAERQAQMDALNAARTAAEKLASASQAEHESANRSLKDAEQRLEQLTHEGARIASERAAESNALARLGSQLEVLNRQKADLERILRERSARLNAREQRVRELEREVADAARRQRQLNDELARAEGQIELIKDFVLREPSL